MASAKLEFLEELEAHLGLAEGNDRPELAAELAIGLVDWAKPLLKPARYKCLYGGRGCIAGDTLIETPNGLVRVDEFQGGLVYAYDRGRRIEALAGHPVKYAPEPLYRVGFSNGTSIKVTAKHRFLADRGWLECGLLSVGDCVRALSLHSASRSQKESFSASGSSAAFSLPQLSSVALPCLYSSASPSALPSDVLHCWRTLLGFLYCCSEYFRRCGLLPPQAPDTYLDVVQQLIDGLRHKPHALMRGDALAFEHIHSLSQPLRRLSTADAVLSGAVRCSETPESHIAARSSEPLWKLSQALQQFPLNTNPLALVHRCAELALDFWLALAEVENDSEQNLSSLQQRFACDIHEIQSLFGRCDDTAYSDSFGSCNHNPHYTLKTVESIEFVGIEPFYDFFVPFFNNYLTEGGIVNHNSGKSFAAADALLIEGLKRKIRVLCAREFQNSIKESVHALLKQRITELGLEDFYRVQEAAIVGANGSNFIFKGIRHNIASIKSMAGITHCWIEEGETISADSWNILIPTIREEGSEIWVTFNPLNESDTVYQQLVATKRDDAYVRRVNWSDNPHFPETLDKERREKLSTDPDDYYWIWEGGFRTKSDAQILNGKWIVEEFTPDRTWDGPYFGADWGFGSDPTTAVKVWIHDRRLYVERESYAHQLELDDTAALWIHDLPGIDGYPVRADSARPESISHVKRGRPPSERDRGCPPIPQLVAAEKWQGSVEDGIAHLRSYEKIIIHPRCKHFAEECRLYSYKVDRLSGDILPIVVDAHQHCIDAARYALAPLIKRQNAPTYRSAFAVRPK